eukprot:IDg1637t1
MAQPADRCRVSQLAPHFISPVPPSGGMLHRPPCARCSTRVLPITCVRTPHRARARHSTPRLPATRLALHHLCANAAIPLERFHDGYLRLRQLHDISRICARTHLNRSAFASKCSLRNASFHERFVSQKLRFARNLQVRTAIVRICRLCNE